MNTTIGMKPDTKQKRQLIKTRPLQDNITTQVSNVKEQHTLLFQQAQQGQYFHLYDQEPQSMNAKRKLQQLSISLNKQQSINSHCQARQTLNLLKRKNVDNKHTYQHERDNNDVGWTDSDVNLQHVKNIQKRKGSSAFNGNRTFHPDMRNSLTKTVNMNSKYGRRQALVSNITPDTRLNLAFNNLLSTDIEIIRDQEISKEILSKIRNSQPKRPTTSSYYMASQKILTLFEKDLKEGKRIGQTIRIHSIRDQQVKNNNHLTLKQRERMLKTCTIGNFYVNNDKNKFLHQNSEDLSKNSPPKQMRITQRLLGRGNKQSVNKNINHYRTYSQPIESGRRKIKVESNQRMRLSNKINQRVNDRKTKRCWDMNIRQQKSQQLSSNSTSNNPSTRYQQFRQSQLIDGDHKQYIHTQHSQCLSLTNKPSQLNPQIIPASNSLQQDFTRLINLLKDQSQHTFGSQLQAYMAQVKNSQQHSKYYMSNGVNKKHTSRNSLNQSIRIKRDKVLRSKMTVNMNLTNDDVINSNNTTRHYSAFSAIKHRAKTNNFLISTAEIM